MATSKSEPDDWSTMPTGAIDCQAFEGLLVDAADADMGVAERACFEAHASACPSCRGHLEAYRLTLSVVRAVGQETCRPDSQPARDDLIAAVMARLDHAQRRNGG